MTRPPAGVVAAAVVAALEVAFFAASPPLTGQPLSAPTADDATVQAKARLVDRAGGAVVLVGDSSCFMGLDPARLEAAAGGPVVNLGTLSSLTLTGFAALTADALDRPTPPRAVVVAVAPYAFELTEKQARDFGLVGRYLVAYGRRPAAYPLGPRDYAHYFARKHQLNTFPPEFGGSYAAFEAALSRSNGFRPEPRTHFELTWVRDTFRPTPFAAESLRELVRACQAKGVPVALWWSPSPAAGVGPEYRAGAAAWAAEFQRTEPWLRVPNPDPPAWPHDLFATETHVNARGAARNAEALAAALPGVLGGRP